MDHIDAAPDTEPQSPHAKRHKADIVVMGDTGEISAPAPQLHILDLEDDVLSLISDRVGSLIFREVCKRLRDVVEQQYNYATRVMEMKQRRIAQTLQKLDATDADYHHMRQSLTETPFSPMLYCGLDPKRRMLWLSISQQFGSHQCLIGGYLRKDELFPMFEIPSHFRIEQLTEDMPLLREDPNVREWRKRLLQLYTHVYGYLPTETKKFQVFYMTSGGSPLPRQYLVQLRIQENRIPRNHLHLPLYNIRFRIPLPFDGHITFATGEMEAHAHLGKVTTFAQYMHSLQILTYIHEQVGYEALPWCTISARRELNLTLDDQSMSDALISGIQEVCPTLVKSIDPFTGEQEYTHHVGDFTEMVTVSQTSGITWMFVSDTVKSYKTNRTGHSGSYANATDWYSFFKNSLLFQFSSTLTFPMRLHQWGKMSEWHSTLPHSQNTARLEQYLQSLPSLGGSVICNVCQLLEMPTNEQPYILPLLLPNPSIAMSPPPSRSPPSIGKLQTLVWRALRRSPHTWYTTNAIWTLLNANTVTMYAQYMEAVLDQMVTQGLLEVRSESSRGADDDDVSSYRIAMRYGDVGMRSDCASSHLKWLCPRTGEWERRPILNKTLCHNYHNWFGVNIAANMVLPGYRIQEQTVKMSYDGDSVLPCFQRM